jgi:alpha-tubulin suppressor-like RCC1 family protein
LTDNGEVWAWGYGGRSSLFGCTWFGSKNPLGNGPSKTSTVPVKVNISNVSQISAGYDFSLALSNGALYGWGEGIKYLSHHPTSLPADI